MANTPSVMVREEAAWRKAGFKPCRLCGVYKHPDRFNASDNCGSYSLPISDPRRPVDSPQPCKFN